jgi:hypothetical protein
MFTAAQSVAVKIESKVLKTHRLFLIYIFIEPGSIVRVKCEYNVVCESFSRWQLELSGSGDLFGRWMAHGMFGCRMSV